MIMPLAGARLSGSLNNFDGRRRESCSPSVRRRRSRERRLPGDRRQILVCELQSEPLAAPPFTDVLSVQRDAIFQEMANQMAALRAENQ